MKSYGDILNGEDLLPLMEEHKNSILEAITNASKDVQDGSSERQKEVIEAVNYVLEQSTDHKQSMERDLENTRETNLNLNETVDQFYTATQGAFQNLSDDLAHSARTLLFMLLGSLTLNLGIAVAFAYTVLSK